MERLLPQWQCSTRIQQLQSDLGQAVAAIRPRREYHVGWWLRDAFNAPNTAAQDQGIIRADYHLSQNDSLWASTIFQSSPSATALSFGGSDLPGFGADQAEHFKIFMASWTHTLGATALNELRAGYYRLNFADVEPTHVVQPSSYGFNITPQSPMANLPLISVSGLNGNTATGAGAFLGLTNEGPQPRKDSNLSAADNFSKILGTHSLKFGVSYEQFGVNNLTMPTIMETIASQAPGLTVRGIRFSTMFWASPIPTRRRRAASSRRSAMSITPTPRIVGRFRTILL